MDIYWERTIPYFKIDQVTATKLLQHFDSHEEIEQIELLSEGKRNTNYKITGKDSRRKYLLRIYALSEKTGQREQAINQRVHQYIPVPEHYYCDYDKNIIGRPFAIFEFIEGITLDYFLRDNPEFTHKKLFHAIGESLAHIHQTTYNRIGFLNQILEVEEILPPLQTWYDLFLTKISAQKLGRARVTKIRRLIEIFKNMFGELDQDARLVHGDFRPTNIIISGEARFHIIDWEFCMAGHPIADIGQFLRYEELIDKKHAENFIDSYCINSNYRLPANYKNIAKLRDLVNLLQMLDTKNDQTYKDQDLINLIDRTIKNKKNEME